MPKFITSIIAFCLASHLAGQTFGGPPLLYENFDNGIPAGWTIFDIDQQPIYPTMIPRGWGQQWQFYNCMAEKCAANCAFLANGGSCDDYLISPAVTIPAGGAKLSWKAAARFSFYNETYDVMISTMNPNLTGLWANPPLMTIAAAPDTWTEYSVDLSSYAGQTVYIGFRHHSASFALFIDEMKISTPVTNDASISSVDLNDLLAPGMYTISGKMVNAGTSTINSVDVNWNLNNGPVNTYSILSATILPGAAYSFTHSIQANLNTPGTYSLKVWTSSPNSSADNYTPNDTLAKIIYVSVTQRRTLVEEYTQASCGPCGSENPHFDSTLYPLIHSGNISSIKYHTNWPGNDPMYTFSREGSDERVFYYGLAMEPGAVVDGEYAGNCPYPGDITCLDANTLLSASSLPALYSMNVAQQMIGNVMNVSVSVTAVTDIPANSMRLFTAEVEDTIIYQFPPGGNLETEFYQVFRYMLPDSSGQPLPAMTANQTLIFNYSYIPDPVIDPNEIATVAFVQDDATRKVYQSTMYGNFPTVVKDAENELSYSLYPVPATDRINLVMNGNNSVNAVCRIFDISGNEVAAPASVDTHVRMFDISSLAAGIYFMKIETESGEHTLHFVKTN